MHWLPLLLAEGEQGGPPMIAQLGPIIIFFVIMMIFMSRSSARQKREQQARLAAVKKNDKVITSSGIIGVVVALKEGEDEVTLRTDDTSNTRIRVLKSSIAHITAESPTAAQPAETKT